MSDRQNKFKEIIITDRKSTQEEKAGKASLKQFNLIITSVEVSGGPPKLTSVELAEILKLMSQNRKQSKMAL